VKVTIARETWKPTCRSNLSELPKDFRIRLDRCQRKTNHAGRCVGNFLVWDKEGVAQLLSALKGVA
jgi:hypothetical protein